MIKTAATVTTKIANTNKNNMEIIKTNEMSGSCNIFEKKISKP